jgi:hypothetical protein
MPGRSPRESGQLQAFPEQTTTQAKTVPRQRSASISRDVDEPHATTRLGSVTRDPVPDESEADENSTAYRTPDLSDRVRTDASMPLLVPRTVGEPSPVTGPRPLSSEAATHATAGDDETSPDTGGERENADAVRFHDVQLFDIESRPAARSRKPRRAATHESSDSEQRRLRDVFVPLVVQVVRRSMDQPLDRNRLARAVEEAAQAEAIEEDRTRNVTVNIDRVEVRVAPTPTSSPAPKPSRRTPALSLDQYLEQRSKGQR